MSTSSGSAKKTLSLLSAVVVGVLALTGLQIVNGGPAAVAAPACTINGTSGQDALTGGSGVDVICGLGDADHLVGKGGNDYLIGGAGNDTLDGRDASGNVDVLDCGTGSADRAFADQRDEVSNCEIVTQATTSPAVTLAPAAVAENEPVGTEVGLLGVTNGEPVSSYQFSLVAGPGAGDNASFTLSGRRLLTAASFDYEADNELSIRVRAIDRARKTFEQFFTVIVTDIDENQAPTNVALSNATVAENEPVGATVGTLSATDPDAGDIHTFSLVAGPGDTDNASFQITGTTLQTDVIFDFETKSSYSIRIEANDGQGGTFQKQFTITVTNAAEAPTNISLSNATVAENQPVATTVGTLSATDPDAGDTHTFTLATGDGDGDNASFQITGTTLKTNAAFDYETKSTYTIRVRATDGNGGTFAKQLTITITNAADAPTNIALSNSSVAENQPSATTVGTLSATDPDAGDTHTFSLVSGAGDDNNASFQIDGATLKTTTAFNFESKSSYTIRVRATDAGNTFSEKQLTITITNANEAPTNIALSNATVAENQPIAATVGTLSATDPDAADTHTYTLVAGSGDTDNASFQIDGATLKANAAFDFETKSSYTIRVQVNDGNGGTFAKQLTITITDVSENAAPTNIALSNSSVAENQPSATTVGTLSATDPNAGDTHTYTLVAGAGDDNNASFQIDGTTLKTNAAFDFETKSSYTIRVQVNDGNGGTFAKQLTITVTDVAENAAPTDVTLSNATVAENQPIATTVGTLSATDPDAGDTHTFTLVAGPGDTDNASFQITGGTTLKTNAAFDFETKSSYSIRIEANDGQGGTFAKQFTVTVTDAADAPTNISLSNATVAENQPAATTVGTLSATDPDAGDTHTFTLVAGPGDTDNASFQITGGTTLKTNAAFDFETKASYTIRVRVTDQDNLTFEKQLTITVTDVGENAAPADIALSNSSVAENDPVATTVGTLSATDPDAGDTHTFTLVTGTGDTDNGSFQITGTTLQTNAVFDFETKPSYAIRVQADDGHGGTFEKHLTITIIDVAEANVAPVLDAIETVDASYTEQEAGVPVTNLLTVTDATDATLQSAQVRISVHLYAGDTLGFADQNGITGSYDAGTGVLTMTGTSSVANYQTALRSIEFRNLSNDKPTEQIHPFDFTSFRAVEFKVNDGEADSNLVTRNVTVIDVNDAPTTTTSPGVTLADAQVATEIDTGVTISDPDLGGVFDISAYGKISGATVAIAEGYVASEDVLALTGVAGLGITVSVDGATVTLTGQGLRLPSHFEEALRAVTYTNTSTTPSTAVRTVRIQVTDGGGATSNIAERSLQPVAVDPIEIAPIPGIAAGGYHSCKLDAAGEVFCWGTVDFGAASPPPDTFAQVVASEFYTCGLRTDGTVKCWGRKPAGKPNPPGNAFTSIDVGDLHACGVRVNGRVACWGVDWDGQGSPPPDSFLRLSTGRSHTCGVKTNSEIVCWGANGEGQSTPPAGTFVSVAAGDDHTCGLKSDGTVACWGNNTDGRATPPGGTYTAITAGNFHSCGVKTDGSVACWGLNNWGQASPPAGTFTAIDANASHACGLRTGGGVACWGANDDGRATAPTGDWTTVTAQEEYTCGLRTGGIIACWGFPGEMAPPNETFLSVDTGFYYACGVTTAQALRCWGEDVPGGMPTGSFKKVSLTPLHACALRVDGTIACWGSNELGQADPPAGTFRDLASGTQSTCAVRTDGTVTCWGADTEGQTNSPAGTFTAVYAGANFTYCGLAVDATIACWGFLDSSWGFPPAGTYTSISMSALRGCGVRTDGTLNCWGSGNLNSPPGKFTAVALSDVHACAVRTDGNLTCWGGNGFGQANPPGGTWIWDGVS